MELLRIDVKDYQREKEKIFSLVERIWSGERDITQAKHSIERWGSSKTESGTYFYIVEGDKTIGLTGYFIPNMKEGVFGLRHHGTSVKGTGKKALDLLFDYLRKEHGESFKCMVELIPEGREEIMKKFIEWGFEINPQGVPEWEPKKNYYKYSLIKSF